jgi:hypothetical protein
MNAISHLHQLKTNCATTDLDQEKSLKFHLTEIRAHFERCRAKSTKQVDTYWITATHREFFLGCAGAKSVLLY